MPDSTASQNHTEPFIPLAGGATDGFSHPDSASATCFCGAVQLQFSLAKPGLVDTFLCNCTDCRKLTSSLSAANFTVLSSPPHLLHLRGEDNLTTFAISSTTTTGNEMVNYFCKTCGSLMYRRGTGFPGMSILRVGTVDDFTLAETVLKPRLEQFVETRVGWIGAAEGVKQVEGYAYGGKTTKGKL